MPVKHRPTNKAPWTAAEHAILERPITEGAAVKALQAELGITRSRSAVGVERRTLKRIKGVA